MRASLLLLLLAAGLLLTAVAAQAAVGDEVIREEPFNYRVVGELPAGWRRERASLAWTFADEEIPHAHIHFGRQRVEGGLDLAAQLEKRRAHYRFPDTPAEVKGKVTEARLGGHAAVRYLLEVKLGGVLCRRRVTVLHRKGFFYELIETIYGASTEERHACGEGLRVFREGFALLTEPMPEAERTDAAERLIRDGLNGYEVTKPAGFLRFEVDTATDPGCRLRFERMAPDRRAHARFRLFEYGSRDRFEPEGLLDNHYRGFVAIHDGARRESAIEAPAFQGAKHLLAERWTGVRDGRRISLLIVALQSRSDRLYVVRIRVQEDGQSVFADGLALILKSLKFS